MISEGWNGEEWKKTWSANKVNVFLLPHESKIVELRNRIKKDTQPGNYTLRVRVVEFGDLDKNLRVEEDSAVNASLKCFQRNGSILLQITNFGRSYNFTLLIINQTLGTRNFEIDKNKTLNLTFEITPKLFVLVGNDRVLGKCRIQNFENKTIGKKIGNKVSGRMVEISETSAPRLVDFFFEKIRNLIKTISSFRLFFS